MPSRGSRSLVPAVTALAVVLVAHLLGILAEAFIMFSVVTLFRLDRASGRKPWHTWMIIGGAVAAAGVLALIMKAVQHG